MRNIKIALGLGSITILGGVLFFRAPSPVLTTAEETVEQTPVAPQMGAENTNPESALVPTVPAQALPASAPDLKTFEAIKELDEYSLLNKKVFLSDQEKSRKTALLQNQHFIEELKKLFKLPSEYRDLENQQNAAVDFLMDALNGAESAMAAEVLKSIIQDPGTENENLSRAARENLAGVKAEVLYKWSAQEPLKANEMQQWLPGPVSQKIWKNVLAQQDMNRAESALTK